MYKKKHENRQSAEEVIMKITGVVLTFFVVIQIVVKEGVHVINSLKASFLETQEIVQTDEPQNKDTYHASEAVAEPTKDTNTNTETDVEKTNEKRKEIEIMENLESKTAYVAELADNN